MLSTNRKTGTSIISALSTLIENHASQVRTHFVGISIANAARTLILIGWLLAVTEKKAQAYTDPGSGILICQMLVAGTLGFAFRLRRVIARFVRRKEESKVID
jgi:hypothetical protein